MWKARMCCGTVGRDRHWMDGGEVCVERRTKEEKCVEWTHLHPHPPSLSCRGKGVMFEGRGEEDERVCLKRGDGGGREEIRHLLKDGFRRR